MIYLGLKREHREWYASINNEWTKAKDLGSALAQFQLFIDKNKAEKAEAQASIPVVILPQLRNRDTPRKFRRIPGNEHYIDIW
jgi:hypothetical protein